MPEQSKMHAEGKFIDFSYLFIFAYLFIITLTHVQYIIERALNT